MNRRLQEEKVFKDPVHKYIYVQDETIWDLINTKEFQRLRRIRQLGTSFYTFHGAEHSRFSHSLGVYEITRKIISQFERHHFQDWPAEEKLLSLCAALLHDIGHWPFSHSFERVFLPLHEEWSCRIVLENTEVNRVLAAVSADFPQKVAEVINRTYRHEIVVRLISSQMDADRMDYLLRDAYFTGVNCGTFDLDRILRVLRPHRGHIVVKESGMHSVEDYLMSRYQMYWQVYFHPVSRSSEIILRKIFQRACHLYEQRFPFRFMVDPLPRLLSGRLTVEDYLLLDESFVQMALMQWVQEDDGILSDLCGRFIHRKLFKYVAMDHGDERLMANLCAAMAGEGIDPEYYIEVDSPTDLPYDVYRPGTAEESRPILLLNDRNQVAEISEQSEVVRSISGIRSGADYLYFPSDLVERAWAALDEPSRRKLAAM